MASDPTAQTSDERLKNEFFLSVVPKEYLVGIIKKQKYSSENLAQMLFEITGQNFQKPNKKLIELTQTVLIEFILENQILNEPEILKLYYDFRDGKNPAFFMFQLKQELFGDLKALGSQLQMHLNEKQLDYEIRLIDKTPINGVKEVITPQSDYKFRNLSFIGKPLIQEDNILELRFEYSERKDYLSEEHIPKFVYHVKSGFLWIDNNNRLIIAKCQDELISTAIIEEISTFLNNRCFRFTFDKFFRDQLFSKEEIVKNNLKAKVLKSDNFKNIIIRDLKLPQKSADPKFLFLLEYDPTSTSYLTNIAGFTGKIHLDVLTSGKIALRGKSIKIQTCRKWLIDILLKLVEIKDEVLKNSDFGSYIRSTASIKDSNIYKLLRNNAAREVLYDLINKVLVLKDNPKLETLDLPFPVELAIKFDKWFKVYFDVLCEEEDCGAQLLCPNEKCNLSQFDVVKEQLGKEFSIKCHNCNTAIKNGTPLNCVEGHLCKVDLNKGLHFLMSSQLRIELNQVFKQLDLRYSIFPEQETFLINANKISRIEISKDVVFDWRTIPNFDSIPSLDDIPVTHKEGQAFIVSQYLEKCKEFAGRCKNCPNSGNKNICLLKILAKISGGQAHPHTATEFGDIDFFAQFPTSREQIVCIVKSNTQPRKGTAQDIFGTQFGTLSLTDDDRLFTQFFKLANLQSMRFLMVISGKLLHPELKQALIYIASIQKKRVIFVEPLELIQISYHYSKIK